jgi:hypothetical protein
MVRALQKIKIKIIAGGIDFVFILPFLKGVPEGGGICMRIKKSSGASATSFSKGGINSEFKRDEVTLSKKSCFQCAQVAPGRKYGRSSSLE